MTMVREKDVEAYLKRQVEKLGGLCWKWGGVGVFGVPDRVVMYNGKVLFVELKSPVGKLTPLQEKRFAEMAERGIVPLVVRSKLEADAVIGLLK